MWALMLIGFSEDKNSGVTEDGVGFVPDSRFGLIIAECADDAQTKALSQWLTKQRMTIFSGQNETVEVADNPFLLYRCLRSGHQNQHQPLPEASVKTVQTQAIECPVKRLGLRETMETLSSLKEKLAVAMAYRDRLVNSRAVGDGKAFSEGVSSEDLVVVHTFDNFDQLCCDEKTGRLYTMRYCQDIASAHNEMLMTGLARRAGVSHVKPVLIENGENAWIVTPRDSIRHSGTQKLPENLPKPLLARLYLTTAWLGHTNPAGRDSLNIGLNDTGDLCVDNWQGSGYFAADGQRKHPDADGKGAFFGTVYELDDYRQTPGQPETATLFESLVRDDLVKAMPDFLAEVTPTIGGLVEEFGPKAFGERRYLLSTLYERLGYLAMRFPDNLSVVTEAELQAVATNGLHGYELAVSCPHIEDQKILIGHQFNASKEAETRISFRLDGEKKAWLADKLELGKSYHELRSRLRYFLYDMKLNRNMTADLRVDLLETLQQAQQYKSLYEKLRDGTQEKERYRIDPEKIEESLEKLNTSIVRLETLRCSIRL